MKMVKTFKTGVIALAAVTGLAGMAVSGAANAETSASFSASNMYLWRGQNLTKSSGQIAGSLDYKHSSGAYAGIWTTNETDGHETDLYVGFGGEVSGFSYDISYWNYLYNEDCNTDKNSCDYGDNDLSEYVLSLGYKPVTFTVYMNADAPTSDDEYNYYTLAADIGKFNVLYGVWDFNKTGANNYSHVTVSYAATDELGFAISKASNDSGYENKPGSSTYGVEEDLLFQVTYSKSFDLK
jgi:uncharacterized protein (TIGR02001 family)